MQGVICLPAEAVFDDKLSDPEYRLLSRMILKSVNLNIKLTDEVISDFGISKSTVYRLTSGLIKREYLSRDQDGSYSILKMGVDIPKNETEQSQISENEVSELQIRKNENMGQESEEKERSKEREEKDQLPLVGIDYNYTLTQIKKDEKEKEIQKKEKAPGGGEEPERYTAEYREIIGYLNEKTGRRYSAKSRANQSHISARLKEGCTVEDFKRVIDIKCFQWKDDPKMAQFLRPETLFSRKFDRYLNEEKYVVKTDVRGGKYVVTEDEKNSDVPF